jgi:hypothetical protein
MTGAGGPHVYFINSGKAVCLHRFLVWSRRPVETRMEVPPPWALPGGARQG